MASAEHQVSGIEIIAAQREGGKRADDDTGCATNEKSRARLYISTSGQRRARQPEGRKRQGVGAL